MNQKSAGWWSHEISSWETPCGLSQLMLHPEASKSGHRALLRTTDWTAGRFPALGPREFCGKRHLRPCDLCEDHRCSDPVRRQLGMSFERLNLGASDSQSRYKNRALAQSAGAAVHKPVTSRTSPGIQPCRRSSDNPGSPATTVTWNSQPQRQKLDQQLTAS